MKKSEWSDRTQKLEIKDYSINGNLIKRNSVKKINIINDALREIWGEKKKNIWYEIKIKKDLRENSKYWRQAKKNQHKCNRSPRIIIFLIRNKY